MMLRPAKHALALLISMSWGLGLWLGLVICLVNGVFVASATGQEAAPQGNTRYWTTNWNFDSIDVKQLNRRLAQMGVGIPIEMEGIVSVNFKVSVPLNAITDGRKYRFEGLVRSSRLQLERVGLEDFQSHLRVADGVMTIDQIQAKLSEGTASGVPNRVAERKRNASRVGTVSGSATLQLSPIGDIDASLMTESVAIEPLHQLLLTIQNRDDREPLDGVVSGELQFRAPLKEIRDIRLWNAKTNLRIAGLSRGDALPLDVDPASISIADGVLRADDLQVRSTEAPELSARVRGRVELIKQQRFALAIRADNLPLEVLTRIAGASPSRFGEGQVDVDATASGELASRKWDLKGRVASPKLRVAGVDLGLIEHAFEFDEQHLRLAPLRSLAGQNRSDLILQEVSANYQLSAQQWLLSNVDARLFGGEITGDASLALDKRERSKLNLKWRGLTPTVNAQLFSLADVVISASSSGEIAWTIPAGDWSRLDDQSGKLDVRLESIKVGEATVGELHLAIAKNADELQLKADGNLFGGEVTVVTRSDVISGMTWRDLWQRPAQIDLSLDALRLDRLIASVPRQVLVSPRYRQLRGQVSADIEWTGTPHAKASDSPWESEMTVQLEHLSMGSVLLTRRLDASVRTQGSSVTIDNVSGNYARGRVTARGQWNLVENDGHLDVQVDSVDATDSIHLVSESVAKRVQGKLSGQFHLTGGRSIRARGAVQASDAFVAGVPVGNANCGLLASYSLRSGQWDASFSSIKGNVARGQLMGQAKIKSSYRPKRFDLASRWSFERVNFAKLISDAGGGNSSYAIGQVRGSLTLAGEGIASHSDLRGQFKTELAGSQAAAIPGLSEAQRFLGAIPLAGIRVESGRLEGTIAGGRARIDEFVLSSPQLKMWAEGFVQLDSNRMDIEAVISTGNFETSQLTALYLQAASFTALSPVSLLIRINQLLSNRTIYVDVGGTLADPKLKLRPLATLRDEVARYLIAEVLGLNCAALSSGNPFDLQD
ncbi:AsmA family protein [Novipirellula galeiformis]|uniref:AsmA family protein n=1 Tax=Novipirellula galeiformis TaxID=2528004 RepID=A0A5C6CUK9_9BACT|nr:AsmA-like C-terminal region-containing protein [Novipirellula galeiformis]TWU27091.1 AsmA family protein [Novipirellula galeiformis]